jgi:hypothetical protein
MAEWYRISLPLQRRSNFKWPLGTFGLVPRAMAIRTLERACANSARLLQHEQESHNPLWGIGLQEVIAETAQYLAPILEKAWYTVFRQPLAAGAWYGCALAVHTSLEVLEQGTTTSQSRGYLYARVPYPFRPSKSCLLAPISSLGLAGDQATTAAAP